MTKQQAEFLNHPVDIMDDFFELENEFFVTGKVTEFDAEKGAGKLVWNYHRWSMDWFFNKIDMHLEKQAVKAAPMQSYESHPETFFSVSFINARTIRLRMHTSSVAPREHPSFMLDGEVETQGGWNVEEKGSTVVYSSNFGKLILYKENWKLELYDAAGKLLNATNSFEEIDGMHSKKYPFAFMKRSSDYSRSVAASFSLFPDEKLYGCGESFTDLNKRGQKMVLYTCDTQSTASRQMYKPVPFFFSSRGYGMFLHTTSPVTMDLGFTHAGSKTMFVGEDQVDLFFFLGSPGDILTQYTALTGRSSMPPLWSFGLWMSRFSYRSEEEVKMVADRLRSHRVPCDVIHIDAGWFKQGIDCDYEFGKDLFPDPAGMMNYLKETGFRTSLWQIPYLTPLNPVFKEVVEKGLYVKDGNGNIPTEDAVLDFSNPDTIRWYGDKIRALFALGASAIKTDFGEAAPLNGLYASGRSGFFEHNNYPLRYTQLVASITREMTRDSITWSRSAWAGGQRNPVHWGGDAEVTDTGMAGSLKGGLSLGLSGFSFWSHDIGGFSGAPKPELFARWAFFGMFTSHSRVHGFPPREPWEFDEGFQEVFRKAVEMRYNLMPYIYTQSVLASAKGWPLLRAMLLDYPEDPTVWELDDQYKFGNDLLVAPILEGHTTSRNVYLSEGNWIDYQTKEVYSGKQWVHLSASALPGIVLVRSGAAIPHIPLAQSTQFMDWNQVYMVPFYTNEKEVRGNLCVPGGNIEEQVISTAKE